MTERADAVPRADEPAELPPTGPYEPTGPHQPTGLTGLTGPNITDTSDEHVGQGEPDLAAYPDDQPVVAMTVLDDSLPGPRVRTRLPRSRWRLAATIALGASGLLSIISAPLPQSAVYLEGGPRASVFANGGSISSGLQISISPDFGLTSNAGPRPWDVSLLVAGALAIVAVLALTSGRLPLGWVRPVTTAVAGVVVGVALTTAISVGQTLGDSPTMFVLTEHRVIREGAVLAIVAGAVALVALALSLWSRDPVGAPVFDTADLDTADLDTPPLGFPAITPDLLNAPQPPNPNTPHPPNPPQSPNPPQPPETITLPPESIVTMPPPTTFQPPDKTVPGPETTTE